VKTRFTRIAAVLIAAGGLAAPAQASDAHITVVSRLDLAQAARLGAVGLAIPALGSTVTRARALEALRSGRLRNPLLGGRDAPVIAVDSDPAGGSLASLQGAAEAASRTGEARILLVLPPDGAEHNNRRYPVVIIGDGYAGELHSPSTRIPGLLTLADIAPTALALSGRPIPGSVTGHVLSARPSGNSARSLTQLDRTLVQSRKSRVPGTIAYVAILVGLAAAAIVLGSAFLGRAALLALPAAAAASLTLALAGSWNWMPFAALTGIAVLMGAWLLRSGLALGLALVAVILFHGIATGADPSAMSFSLLGPNPAQGGRFFGFSNTLETVLLGTTVVAGALLWEHFGTAALMIVGGLGVVVMASGRAGASVTGAIEIAVAYGVLALGLEGPLGLIPFAVVAGAAAAVLAFAGPPHLAGAGAGSLVNRIETSAHLSVDSVQSGLLTFAVGLAPLLVLAACLPRLRPRLDRTARVALVAMLVGLLVSVIINDTPTAVLAHGSGWCLALIAYGLTRLAEDAAGSSYTLAPVWAGSPSRSRSQRSP